MSASTMGFQASSRVRVSSEFTWVFDSGTPSLSATQSFKVFVNEVNSAPTLEPIADQTMNELTTLNVTNVASDADLPAQTLTFTLDPGAPSGASISAAGVFTWTPTEAQGPGSYTVSVRVTDNGSPALSDAQSLTITVNEVNTAPVLGSIANQTITAGSQLIVTNSATDADIPANTLTFSLDPGAPAGAGIDPANGLFTWTPSTNQAPSTNAVTVRVADNGFPTLSDAKTFTIVVNTAAPLQFTSITMSVNSVVTLIWTSQSGKTYRLEFKDDLDQTNWNTLGDFNATGNATSATNTVSGTPQRYYRVQQL